MIRKILLVLISLLLVTACIPLTPGVNATATQEALNQSATQTAAAFVLTPTATIPAEITPPAQPSPTFTQPAPLEQQFLAYESNGQLLVTEVTNGVQGGTTQYTLTGESDQVSDLVWSPSGEFVAFVSSATGEPHVMYIFALGQSSPTDLGPGTAPAWSPDSQSIAYIGGTFPNEGIWITPIENPAPRQLTFETNYAWGRPAFTPDGGRLVVAGADRMNMGAQGNTTFTLEYLALDGSGARTPLPGATPFEGGRLPYDLHFSPDGTRLAFSSSYHWSACASPGAYYVSGADGSNRQEFVSPSLRPAIDTNQERFHLGSSYAWMPTGDAVVGVGTVMDCSLNSPTIGPLAGPQMSVIRLDGSEGTIIPGFFYGISADRTGSLIAAAHYEGGFQDMNPIIKLYATQSGQLVLSLGPGRNPQFQP